jgi:dihydroxyacetone kinase-like predicted kinase
MSRVGVLDAAQVQRAFTIFGQLVAEHAALLDRLNAFPVPDADTGRNLSATMRAALAPLPGLDVRGVVAPSSRSAVGAVAAAAVEPATTGEPAAATGSRSNGPWPLDRLCHTLADGLFLGARGNSGTILAQLLGGFFEVAGRGDCLDAAALAAALVHAAEVGPLAVAQVAAGTMLTVAADVGRAAGRVLEAADGPTTGVVGVLEAAWSAGQRALARTIDENPVLARAGVIDAGAAGYLLLLDAFLHVADGRPLPQPDPSLASAFDGTERTLDGRWANEQIGATAEPDGAYEVMFSLEPAGARTPSVSEAHEGGTAEQTGATPPERSTVIAALGAVGRSVVVTGRPGSWTCHVHTDDIAGALSAVEGLGQARRVRVELLHQRH